HPNTGNDTPGTVISGPKNPPRQGTYPRCRQDLIDVRFADQPVSEIGARWGLLNPAHFSRTFKAILGCPPTQYRAAMWNELRAQRTRERDDGGSL
ncbi:helix-turn-helix domain-containing protein, partial [Mycobacterium sherrisii]